MKRYFSWIGRFICIALSVISLNAFSSTDRAEITVSGTVRANTCTLDNNSPTVILPTVSARDFGGNKGNVLAKRPVSILLKDCGEMARQVRVTTHGESDSNNISAFSNQATRSGGAAGVGLYFYTTDGEHLLLPDGSAYEDIAIHASADNSLTFYAGYVSTKDVVTAGSFQSVVYVEFNYL